MISKKRLKLKMYEKPPPIDHTVVITVENGWGWWNCSCGEWSDTQWDKPGDVIFWARLHEAAVKK